MLPSADERERYYEERVRHHQDDGHPFDPASAHLLISLLHTHEVVHGRLSQRLGQHGLSPSAFNVLMVLRGHGGAGCPLHRLGALLLVSRPNVTGLVDSLEAQGLVRRVPDAQDRRVRLAVLTGAGTRLLGDVLPEHRAAVQRDLAGLDVEEKEELIRLLRKVRESVRRAEEA